MQERADRAFKSAEANGALQVLRRQDSAEPVRLLKTASLDCVQPSNHQDPLADKRPYGLTFFSWSSNSLGLNPERTLSRGIFT
jgi:hypothetical protein